MAERRQPMNKHWEVDPHLCSAAQIQAPLPQDVPSGSLWELRQLPPPWSKAGKQGRQSFTTAYNHWMTQTGMDLCRFLVQCPCIIIQILNEDVEQGWIQYWPLSTMLVTGLQLDFIQLITSLNEHTQKQPKMASLSRLQLLLHISEEAQRLSLTWLWLVVWYFPF